MLRKLKLILCGLLVSLLWTVAATAAVGPTRGTAPFQPKLPFNPTCAIKVDPPVEALRVNQFDYKVFGYVRYCAVRLLNGNVRVAIINQFTNGNHFLGSLGDVTQVDWKTISRNVFESVRSWSWNFNRCK